MKSGRQQISMYIQSSPRIWTITFALQSLVVDVRKCGEPVEPVRGHCFEEKLQKAGRTRVITSVADSVVY